MIGLGGIERFQLVDARHDRTFENLQVVKLFDVRLGHALLIAVRIENSRAVLRANIRALPVELRRVVCDREKNLKNFAI